MLAVTKSIVNVSNSCGSITDTIHVFLQDCECDLYIPNAFTPNRDVFNEMFQVYFECPPLEYELYSIGGEKLFSFRRICRKNGMECIMDSPVQLVFTFGKWFSGWMRKSSVNRSSLAT